MGGQTNRRQRWLLRGFLSLLSLSFSFFSFLTILSESLVSYSVYTTAPGRLSMLPATRFVISRQQSQPVAFSRSCFFNKVRSQIALDLVCFKHTANQLSYPLPYTHPTYDDIVALFITDRWKSSAVHNLFGCRTVPKCLHRRLSWIVRHKFRIKTKWQRNHHHDESQQREEWSTTGFLVGRSSIGWWKRRRRSDD